MRKGLAELREMQALLNDVPVIIAGDLFDKWNVPPSLINLALDELPKYCYAIPGQHDLPYHSSKSVGDSAYGTLCKAGKIRDMGSSRFLINDICVHAFPWGVPFANRRHRKNHLNIAVAHQYFWKAGHGYVGADEKKSASVLKQELDFFDACFFGDNHQGFMLGDNVMNCGTFFRRKSDEIQYKPQVGLLSSKGKIYQYFLQRDDDQFIDVDQAFELVESAIDMTDFMQALSKMGQDSLDFLANVQRFLQDNKIDVNVAKKVMEAVDAKTRV